MGRKSPTGLRLEGRKVRKMLQACLLRTDTHNFSVGCSGSSVVTWRQLSKAGGASSNSKWMKWTPHDVDIFVCGEHGKTRETFNAYVRTVRKRMEEKGYLITKMKTYQNKYIMENIMVSITDLEIEGLDTVISFVQSPAHETVLEVVAGFDLDIVRIVFDFRNGSYIMADNDKEHLDAGVMKVSERILELVKFATRSSFVKQKISSTYDRLAKYRERGFDLENEEAVMKQFKVFLEFHGIMN